MFADFKNSGDRVKYLQQRAFESAYYFIIFLTAFQFTGDALMKRMAHGDGAYNFFASLQKFQQSGEIFQWVEYSNVTRAFVMSIRGTINGISLIFFPAAFDAFYFSQFSFMVITLILVLISTHAIKKLLGIYLSFYLVVPLLTLMTLTNSFPGAEIIMAAPLAAWWIAAYSRRDVKMSHWYKFIPTIVVSIFGSQIHEVIIVGIAIITAIAIIEYLFEKKSEINSSHWQLFLALPSMALGLVKIISSWGDAPTSDSIFQASILRVSDWPKAPLVPLLLLSSITVALFFKNTAGQSNQSHQSHNYIFRTLIILIPAIIVVAFIRESPRKSDHWSFVMDRQNLLWLLILQFFILGIRSIRHQGIADKLPYNRQTILSGALIFLVSISLFCIRVMEAEDWKSCKIEENKVLNQSSERIVHTSKWPTSRCDWGWTDPFSKLLLNNSRLVFPLPDGNIPGGPVPNVEGSNLKYIYSIDVNLEKAGYFLKPN